MKHGARVSVGIAVVLAMLLGAGCATRFSPDTIRNELERQRGQAPSSAFELNLGRVSTLLIRSLLASETEQTPFGGLGQLQVALFEATAGGGPVLDVTQIETRGWERAIRTHDEKRSALVLVRSRADSIADLVLVGAGPKHVVYARLRGSLDPELPSRLVDMLRDGGPLEVQRALGALNGDN